MKMLLARRLTAVGCLVAAVAAKEDSCAADLVAAQAQLKKTAEEADTCEQAKGMAEQNLQALQAQANEHLGQAEVTIKGLNEKIVQLETDAEGQIQTLAEQQTATAEKEKTEAIEKIQKKLSTAEEKLKTAEKKAKEAEEKLAASAKDAAKEATGSASPKELQAKYDSLQKKYDTLKKAADEEADASEKAQNELKRKLKSAQAEAQAASKEASSTKAAAAKQAAQAESSKASTGAISIPFVEDYVDFALFGKLSGVLYRNLLHSHVTQVQSLGADQFSKLKKDAFALSKTVAANLKDASGAGYVKAVDTYHEVIRPQVEVGMAHGQVLYKAHAAKHLDPVLITASKTYASLNVDKHVNTGLEMAKSAGGDLYIFAVDRVVPAVTEFVASKNSLEDVKGFVLQPLTFELFGEKVKLSNGVGDLVVLLLLSIGIVYFLVYQFLLKFLVWNVIMKTAVYKIALKFLVRKVLVSLIIGLTWKLVSLVFSVLVFFVKLAFCCGCCGLCFRRKAAAKGSSTKSKVSTSSPATLKKPLTSPTATTSSSNGKKKR
ncbi:unnamed protein product [Amoebophrya sp. A25]|nr:unnamed protein product [Amoebophrya sp. A25]|eukprot:GSA25T00026847001.1